MAASGSNPDDDNGGRPVPSPAAVTYTDDAWDRLAPPRPDELIVLFRDRDTTYSQVLRENQSVVVGRDAPANVVLTDPSLSRTHARLSATTSGLKIEDLDSKNGTFVDAQRIHHAQLGPGDEFWLARVHVLIHAGTPSEPVPWRRLLRDDVSLSGLDQRRVGVALLDAHDVCVWHNEHLGELLELGDLFTLDAGKTLRFCDAIAARWLKHVRCGLQQPGQPCTEQPVINIPRGPSQRSFLATAFGVNDAGHDPPTGLLCLAIVDPYRPAHIPGDVLQQIYGLSPSETDVANDLLGGSSPQSIATARKVTLATIRTQLSSVFAKTGTKSQGELIRLLLLGAAKISGPASTSGPSA